MSERDLNHTDRPEADGRLERRLERMRYRGFRGGFITRHRALLFSPCDTAKLATGIGLLAGVLAVWYLSLDAVARLWGGLMGFWCSVLGVGGAPWYQEYTLAWVIHFDVPYVAVPSGLPTARLWWGGAIFTLVLAVVSLILPRRWLPVSYFIRIVAFFQLCAQVFFAFWPTSFPYDASGYIHTMLIAGLAVVTLIPIALFFTYYLFDFSFGRKVVLTLMAMVHVILLIPLQYVVHAFVLYHLSLLFLPLLFFVVGLPLNVLIFIAFYSWGFSWQNDLHEQRVQWKVRRRFV